MHPLSFLTVTVNGWNLVMKNRSRTFSIITFGCKLNQYESECIRETLEKMAWTYREFDEGAEYFIINSCTVTGKSDSRCRNAVRRGLISSHFDKVNSPSIRPASGPKGRKPARFSTRRSAG